MCDVVYNTKVHHFSGSSSPWREFMITVGKNQSRKHNSFYPRCSICTERVFYGSTVAAGEFSHGIINQTFASQIVLCFVQIKRQSLFVVICFSPSTNLNSPLHKNYRISFNFLFASLFKLYALWTRNKTKHSVEKS